MHLVRIPIEITTNIITDQTIIKLKANIEIMVDIIAEFLYITTDQVIIPIVETVIQISQECIIATIIKTIALLAAF